MKNNLTILYFYRYIAGGFLLLLFLFWLRFLRTRAIGPIDFTYTHVKFISYILSIWCFSFLLLVTVLYPLYLIFRKKKRTKNKYIRFLKIMVIKKGNYIKDNYKTQLKQIKGIFNLYTTIIDAFTFFLYSKTTPRYIRIWLLFRNILLNLLKQPLLDLYLILIYYCPPTIIAIAFFYDVVIQKSFYYFPISIFLMIIPISFRIILQCMLIACKARETDLLGTKISLITLYDNGNARYDWHKNCQVSRKKRTKALLMLYCLIHCQILGEEKALRTVKTYILFSNFRFFSYFVIYLTWILSFSIMLYRILE